MTKCLKLLVQLYSSYSTETASVVLELFLNTLDSSNFVFANGYNVEPELLLTLLKAVVDIIETKEGKKYDTALQSSATLDSAAEVKVPSTGQNFRNETLVELLQDSICDAAKKLELVKQKRKKSKIKTMSNGDVGALNTWVVVKSWKSCPIGMLPRDVGSYGCLPVLDYDDNKQAGPEPSERKEMWELKQCSDKREASCIIDLLDNSSVKEDEGDTTHKLVMN
ncbi:hypothetical protein EZV62_027603 [Acer yangbiense]|uniref:Uncharacterized protein n=1 Tax=Acer yangbiense TaxID=1000413 RepID=A0A5C7GUY0_9ROSI|nr:hypothetical protein EZV62_027603 [Acer yangbiense]